MATMISISDFTGKIRPPCILLLCRFPSKTGGMYVPVFQRNSQFLQGSEMQMADKSLTCRDCGSAFVFTEGEQAFYAEKGFANEPSRCRECRSIKKANSSHRGGSRGSFNSPRYSRH